MARKAFELGIVRGRSVISVVAASFYLVIQVTSFGNFPLQANRISAALFEVKRKEIAKSYRLLHLQAEELFPNGFDFVNPISILDQHFEF